MKGFVYLYIVQVPAQHLHQRLKADSQESTRRYQTAGHSMKYRDRPSYPILKIQVL